MARHEGTRAHENGYNLWIQGLKVAVWIPHDNKAATSYSVPAVTVSTMEDSHVLENNYGCEQVA